MELGDVTQHNLKQLRKLNSVIFPVSYSDKVCVCVHIMYVCSSMYMCGNFKYVFVKLCTCLCVSLTVCIIISAFINDHDS